MPYSIAKRFQWIEQALHGLGLTVAYWTCRVLPITWVSGLGAWRGRYRGKLGQTLEARARHNLTAMGSDHHADSTITELKRAAGRAALETFIADRIVKQGQVHWHDCELLDHAIACQQSIVFVLAHLDNVGDVLGAAIVKRFSGAREHAVLTRHIQEPTLGGLIRRTRLLSFGTHHGWIEAPSPGIAKRALSTLLNGPATLVLHIDEARQHQVHVPSFGRPLAVKGTNIHYAVRFAKRSGAILVALSMRRDDDRPTHFHVKPLFTRDMAVANHQKAPDATCIVDIDEAFATHIKKHPASWLQLYHLRMGKAQSTT